MGAFGLTICEKITKYSETKQYKPKRWLFEGAKTGKHSSVRAVQAIFKRACRKAEIKKRFQPVLYDLHLQRIFWKAGLI